MTINGYSRELYEHHSTQLRHQEADLRALDMLLAANEHRLKAANQVIQEQREALMAANAWIVVLPLAVFVAGVCGTVLCRSWL